ncbi:MAG: tetratricopeptide repeat protein, partial [Caulobacteraceae bacterium]
AWLLLGVIDMWQGQHDSAAALMHEAIALNPSFSPAYAQLGTCYILSGEPGDGIRTIHTALRLTPQDNKNFHRFGQLALANIMLENYDEAVNSANSALARRPGYSFGHVYGAAALWMNGDHEEAERAAAKLLSSRPDYDLELLKAIPFKDRIWNDRLYGAMSQLFVM